MFTDMQSMSCMSCGKHHKLSAVFEHCHASWPEHYVLYFNCPDCHSKRHIQVHDDCVAFGYLDVTPGPRFVSQQEVLQPGLTVIAEDEGVELSLDEHSWFVPRKY